MAWIFVGLACSLIGYPARMADRNTETVVFCRVSVVVKGVFILIGGIWLCIVCDGNTAVFLLAGILCASLLSACFMDVESHLVYNYVWWIGSGAGISMLCLTYRQRISWILPGLLIFTLLQELLFPSVYGRADCHAFSSCALGLSGLGMGFTDYLIHMLLTFLILGTVQTVRKNVTAGGRLKREVAFLPYIVCSFWICGFLHEFFKYLNVLDFSV